MGGCPCHLRLQWRVGAGTGGGASWREGMKEIAELVAASGSREAGNG